MAQDVQISWAWFLFMSGLVNKFRIYPKSLASNSSAVTTLLSLNTMSVSGRNEKTFLVPLDSSLSVK